MRELTLEEKEILDLSAKLWNKILDLKKVHPSDMQETSRDIHNIQNRIMSRPYVEIQYKIKD